MSLTGRTQAISLSVEELLYLVHDGRVRVPEFQRALRWDAEDIRLLLDSVYRGYPIGTLLFWKRPAEAAVVRIGPVRIEAPARHDALWVVDGQQRIATLAGVLMGDDTEPTTNHALFFDLAQEQLQRLATPPPLEPGWLPLDHVADSTRLLRWLHQHGQDMEPGQVDTAIRLGKRIREYRIPAYVVDSEDERPVREIFERIHTGGKPLAAADVFEALHNRWQESAPSGHQEIIDALEETEFGRMEEKLVLDAALAVTGHAGNRRAQPAAHEAPAALARTRDALRRAIVFLQRDAGIPHIGLMPYRLPLITLARLFDLHPEPEPRSLVLLARWLWRGAISRRHASHTAATRKTLQAIGPDQTRAVESLLGEVGHAPGEPLPLAPHDLRYARSRIHTLALWALGPRHLATGKRLRVSELMAHHPPTHPIRPQHQADPPWMHGLANRLLHPPVPGGFHQSIIEQKAPDVLASHGISPAAQVALQHADEVRFLVLREQTLQEHVTRFLEAKAQWHASDRPPIASLIVED